MAAISNHVSRYPFAALRDAAPVAGGGSILWALWMCAVLAFSLLLVAGFVA